MKKYIFLIFIVYCNFVFAQNEEEKIFSNAEVEKPAKMCGDHSELIKFLSTISYNNVKKEDVMSHQKRVCIKFVVEKDGSLSTFSPCKGDESVIEKCLIEGMKKCPKWEPAIHQGKNVRVSFMLPISCLKFE
jgi:protein TonB